MAKKILDLKVSDVRTLFDEEAYVRGRQLFEKNSVVKVDLIDAASGEGIVADDGEWHLRVDLERDIWECKCKASSLCQHLAAFLLEISHHRRFFKRRVRQSEYADILEHFSKRELIDMLLGDTSKTIGEMLATVAVERKRHEELKRLKTSSTAVIKAFKKKPTMDTYRQLCVFDEKFDQWSAKKKALVRDIVKDAHLKVEIALFEGQVIEGVVQAIEGEVDDAASVFEDVIQGVPDDLQAAALIEEVLEKIDTEVLQEKKGFSGLFSLITRFRSLRERGCQKMSYHKSLHTFFSEIEDERVFDAITKLSVEAE